MRRLPSAEAVLRLLRLAVLDVPIYLLLADARGRSCHFVGRPPELLVDGTLELIGPPPRSDKAPNAYDLPREVPVFVHLLFLSGITGFTGHLVPGFVLRHRLLERHFPGFLSQR